MESKRRGVLAKPSRLPRPIPEITLNPSLEMNNIESSPVNEWNNFGPSGKPQKGDPWQPGPSESAALMNVIRSVVNSSITGDGVAGTDGQLVKNTQKP
jgi:hypothetical protein